MNTRTSTYQSQINFFVKPLQNQESPSKKCANAYTYGFNGQEKETQLNPSITSAEYWFYDGRLGRRWNVDPVVKPWESGYATFANNTICFVDPKGDNARVNYDKNTETYTIQTTIFITGDVPKEKDFIEKLETGYKETFKDFNLDCSTIKFDINVKFVENVPDDNKEKIEGWQNGDNLITFIPENKRSITHLNPKKIFELTGEATIYTKYRDGENDKYSSNKLIPVILHETGHLFGLKDRYKDLGGITTPISDYWKNNLMGDHRRKLDHIQYENLFKFINKEYFRGTYTDTPILNLLYEMYPNYK